MPSTTANSAPNTWTPYRVCLPLQSALHCGWRTTGNLKQTRPYVPGMAIWGALTARLARDKMGEQYEAAGNRIHQQLRFTYLYPSTNQEKVALWPWGDRAAEFEWQFLGSYISTAAAGATKAAHQGSLHEIEFIGAKSRQGKQVYLIGHCWRRDDFPLPDLEALYAGAQFGGERSYGFGRVAEAKLVETGATDPVFPQLGGRQTDPPACFRAEVADKGQVTLTAVGEAIVPAHVPAKVTIPELKAARVEVLVGRRIQVPRQEEGHTTTTQAPRAGFVLTPGLAAYAPGTLAPAGTRFALGDFGLLSPA